MHHHTRVGGVSIVLMGVVAVATVCASVPAPGILPPSLGLVDRFLAPDLTPLVSYRAFRRLTASTRGGRMEAALDAWTSLDPKAGFAFHVTAEEGSATIRQRVLVPVLEAEQKAMKGASPEHMALTRDNYEFLTVSDDSDNLMRVDIKPRHKHAMLINGSVFLAGDTADLVRVEGEPSERPSFWTRHVRIVREYARVLGVRVPVAMRSTADVLIGGSSNFSMTYRYTDINGVAVAER
jgi:hypothetical protein